jgi:phage portal protein BeeE
VAHDLFSEPESTSLDHALADRAALWERVAKADFLTVNEKRQMTGFGPVEGGDRIA